MVGHPVDQLRGIRSRNGAKRSGSPPCSVRTPATRWQYPGPLMPDTEFNVDQPTGQAVYFRHV